MSRFSSLLTVGTLLPLMWFSVVPHAAKYCEGNGYSVSTVDGQGNPVTLTFHEPSRLKLCELVRAFPAR